MNTIRAILGAMIALSLFILIASAISGDWLGVIIGILLVINFVFNDLMLRNRSGR
jgi:hypothetical protein